MNENSAERVSSISFIQELSNNKTTKNYNTEKSSKCIFLLTVAVEVAVEGNIGSGKNTFLSYCENDADFEVYEPVAEWKNVHGVILLVKSYQTETNSFRLTSSKLNWNWDIKE